MERVFKGRFDVPGLLAGGFDEFGQWTDDPAESFAPVLHFEYSPDRVVEPDAAFDHLIERCVAGFEADAFLVEGVDPLGKIATRGVERFDAGIEGGELLFVLFDL